MSRRPAGASIAAAMLAAVAVAARIQNALRYPPDWGFDATFNWRYIYRLTQDGRLPHPEAGWSTADPPLFFALAAGLMRVSDFALPLVPLFNTLLGLGVVALAVRLVRRADPAHPRRALLAGGLLLFLPAHIHMSAMVSEEMLVAFLVSLAVYGLAVPPADGARARFDARRSLGVGVAAGLAMLAKLTGVLAAATAAATLALDGARRAEPRRAVAALALVLAAAFATGGWYFARNLALYGYVQPFGLPAHERMFEMPPGQRGVLDFVRVPRSTFTDPQLLDPDLLRSVWGSTYATVWFDGHRYFLPRDSDAVRRLGSVTLVLALLPTLAFAIGTVRGARRAWRGRGDVDTPLVFLTAFALVGYAAYNWQNPWFTVVKGTSLLVLCLPFAFYASDSLERLMRVSKRSALASWIALGLLAIAVVLSGTFDLVFEKTEVSGLPWETKASP